LIALIQTLKAIVKSAADDAGRDGNLLAAFCLYCLACIIGLIEQLALYFNKYAFTQVAIYGKDFCTAGKDTWRLAKSRGIDAIINAGLIGNVLGMGTFFSGILCGGIAALATYLYLNGQNLAAQQNGGFIAASAILGLILGVSIFAIMTEVIESGVASTFVCLAEDPYALRRTQPEFFQKVAEVYPPVLNTV